VKQEGDRISVKGPNGELGQQIPKGIQVTLEDGRIVVTRESDHRQYRSLHGLIRTLIFNMVTGVTKGFNKDLEIVGVGYRAEADQNTLTLTLGYAHPIHYRIPEGISISVDRNVIIKVQGIDKQQVGQVAADIRAYRRPEPYKGKGIRYVGEYVRKKMGKGAAGGR